VALRIGVYMIALLLSLSTAQATGLGSAHGHHGADPSIDAIELAWLEPHFQAAAAEFQVPQELLMALAWEASRWDAEVTSAWGGYGLFDLREEDGDFGPRIEDAAILLGISPDEIIADPRQQIRAAAAMLARSAAIAHGSSGREGRLPDVDDLGAWVRPITGFSGRHEPAMQQMFARYIFEVVQEGAERGGLSLEPSVVEYDEWIALPPPPASCDYSGCYQFTSASTANYSDYSRTASDISWVIIHTVQGSYSGCISWFQNSSASVSAHYVVRSSDGQVTQMVKEADVAWHAGNWTYNAGSVGIEHEGYVDSPETWYTDAMYASSAALTADIAARNGITPSASTIIAHSVVPGTTHTDPGSGWDWDYYLSLVSGGAATGDLLGVVAIEDIYSGDRLPGATVWIAETGETTTVESDGYYRFYDLPTSSYTVWASYPGYLDASCAKTITTGTNWCSIALQPDPGGGTETGDGGGSGDGGGDTGDGGVASDGGAGDGGAGDGGTDGFGPGDEPSPGRPPGSAVPLNDLSSGCASAPAAPVGLSLAVFGLLALGRRRASSAERRRA